MAFVVTAGTVLAIRTILIRGARPRTGGLAAFSGALTVFAGGLGFFNASFGIIAMLFKNVAAVTFGLFGTGIRIALAGGNCRTCSRVAGTGFACAITCRITAEAIRAEPGKTLAVIIAGNAVFAETGGGFAIATFTFCTGDAVITTGTQLVAGIFVYGIADIRAGTDAAGQVAGLAGLVAEFIAADFIHTVAVQTIIVTATGNTIIVETIAFTVALLVIAATGIILFTLADI